MWRVWSVGVLLSGTAVLAQDAPATTAANLPRGTKADRDQVLEQIRGSAVLGDPHFPGYQLVLEGTTKDQVATASATWTSKDDSEMYEIKLSGPIDEGVKVVEPLTLDGLQGSFTAKVTWQKFDWRKHTNDKPLKRFACELGSHAEICEDQDFLDGKKPKLYDLTAPYLAASPEERRRICRVVQASGTPCTAGNLAKVNLFTAYLSLAGAHENPRLFGASVSVGRQTFDHLDPANFSDLSASHNNWTVSGHLGKYWPTRGYLGFKATLKNSWSPAEDDPDEICRPIAASDATRCRVVAIGFPTDKTSVVGTLEWRRFLSGDLAINPILSWDIKKDVATFQLPVYFLPGDKGLTGGVRLGWKSDKNDISVAVFVGVAALDLVP